MITFLITHEENMIKDISMSVTMYLTNGHSIMCYLVEAEVWMKSPTLYKLIERVEFA